jgi:hypothetical protein
VAVGVLRGHLLRGGVIEGAGLLTVVAEIPLAHRLIILLCGVQ